MLGGALLLGDIAITIGTTTVRHLYFLGATALQSDGALKVGGTGARPWRPVRGSLPYSMRVLPAR
jgi:hypothetical protein